MTILPPDDAKRGLLLVGHGTRDRVGCEEFLATARAVAERLPQWAVEPSFLELAEPTIDAAVERLAERGINQMSVLPLLLFAAAHAKQDIPRSVEAAIVASGLKPRLWPSDDGGDCLVRQLPHLGCHARLLELSALRFREANESSAAHAPLRPRQASEQTALILVGRGSRDAEATREMFHFAQLRNELISVACSEVCFVAMAEPTLEQCLAEIANSPCSKIVIQPHLLFAGQLLANISTLVEKMALRYPEKEWIVTRHLAPHSLLEAALADLVVQQASIPPAR